MTAATDQSQNQINLGITIEQARATIWPFNDFKGQTMGALVDAKKLSLKDLGFAAENAWDDRVRRAAMALMLARITTASTEPAPAAGYVRVISGGRSYSTSRQFLYTYIQGAFLGVCMGGAMGYVLTSFALRPTTTNTPSLAEFVSKPAGLIGFILALAFVIGIAALSVFLVFKISDRIDKQIANHRKGEEGEDAVIARLTQLLDGNWTVFRNVLLPGRKGGDLDLVLVGQTGVWAIETKYYAGEYRNIGEHWEYKKGKRWNLVRKSPSRQATNNALRLHDFLKADSIDQWITPVVVWANQENPLLIENPATAVWTPDNLPDMLGALKNSKPTSNVNRQKIIDKLTKLCERQRQKAGQDQE